MMPDLGKYADAVLWSYAASLVLLVALVVFSILRGRKVRAEMEKIENRMTRNG
ncbi:heme exporter protein CcmD [Ruegeria sp. R14_0]|uniref:heme exporter protein CcmD n=1 Tax=Ruegeria sp. R14_0 TaxID=2821100 RepID=UPI001AD96E58|nr:heme exporter protein CcmD [Ruegeria sp. R14_0]MBO9444651.1 heme exporter protein CcmD [Ruegeria sp. R14_0]